MAETGQGGLNGNQLLVNGFADRLPSVKRARVNPEGRFQGALGGRRGPPWPADPLET